MNVAVIIGSRWFYLLGDRSKMYKEFGNETAIFEREATLRDQSMVAGHVFRLVDADKSGGWTTRRSTTPSRTACGQRSVRGENTSQL